MIFLNRLKFRQFQVCGCPYGQDHLVCGQNNCHNHCQNQMNSRPNLVWKLKWCNTYICKIAGVVYNLCIYLAIIYCIFQGWQSGQKISEFGFQILLRIFCIADSDSNFNNINIWILKLEKIGKSVQMTKHFTPIKLPL